MSGIGNGEAMAQTLKIVAQAGKNGVNNETVAKNRGVRQQSSLTVMMRLVKSGEVILFRHSTRDVRYYLPRHAPKGGSDWQMSQTRRLADERDKAVKVADGEPIITARTKITRAEPFVDKRFAFDPPKGWVGEITKDWRARRLEGMR